LVLWIKVIRQKLLRETTITVDLKRPFFLHFLFCLVIIPLYLKVLPLTMTWTLISTEGVLHSRAIRFAHTLFRDEI